MWAIIIAIVVLIFLMVRRADRPKLRLLPPVPPDCDHEYVCKKCGEKK